MASTTEIANLAISHLGIGKEISNIDTDRSQEANACKRYFKTARDATLRDFNWSFATKINKLALIKEIPNKEWGYSYRYPTDCIHARRILTGKKNESRQQRIAYKIAKDDAGKIIFTDEQEAELEYTTRVEDPTFYSEDFIMAFSFRLAAYIAPRITKGDPFKLKSDMLAQYTLEIERAKSNALNEEQVVEEVESEFVRVRNGGTENDINRPTNE